MFSRRPVLLWPIQETLSSSMRERHFSYMKTPRHESQRFGGRACRIRQSMPLAHGAGLQHLKYPEIKEQILSVYEAQERSRREWKSRDYDIYEMPFSLAPRELQRVIPEPYTELPLRASTGALLSHVIFEREVVAKELFPDQLISTFPKPDPANPTLDEFLYLE